MQADKIVLRQIVRSDIDSGWLIAADSEGTDHILHSEDSGYSWKDTSPPEPLRSNPDYPLVAEGFFLNKNSAWVVYTPEPTSVSSLRVWRTLDGGSSWQASQELAHDPPGGLDTPLYLDFINPLEGWLLVSHGAAAGSQPVSLYQTRDGGQTWLRILDLLSPLSGGINICCQSGMRFADPLNGIITTSSGPDPTAHVNWTSGWRSILDTPGSSPPQRDVVHCILWD